MRSNDARQPHTLWYIIAVKTVTDEQWHPVSFYEQKCINLIHSILSSNTSHASKEGRSQYALHICIIFERQTVSKSKYLQR